MKKILIYGAVALSLALTACDEKNDGPWGVSQVNPQPEIYEVEGLKVAPAASLESGVNLNTDGQLIQVASIEQNEKWPEGYDLQAIVQVSPSEDFSTYKELYATVTDNEISVDPAVWQNYIREEITKSPAALPMFIRTALWGVDGTKDATVRLGGPDVFFAPAAVVVTPVQSYTIEDKYYLVGDFNSWDLASAVPFGHSTTNVYDDPTFTANVQLSGKSQWLIVPESVYLTNTLGTGTIGVTEASEPMKGQLLANGPKGDIDATGPYRLIVNMEEMTYEWGQAIEYLYTSGNANGWSFTKALATTDFEKYKGFTRLDTRFKLTAQEGWSPISYGTDGNLGVNAASWEGHEGPISANIAPGGGNVFLPANSPVGLYWMDVNLSTLVWSVEYCNQMSIIGSFEGSGWSTDIDLTPSDDMNVWTGVVTLKEGDKFKFRMNHAWTAGLGGSIDELTPWGGNVIASESGTFTVTLYLGQLPYYCSFAKH